MTSFVIDSVGQKYVALALAIEEHTPGYIDGYYGPPEWRAAAQATGKRPLAELGREAGELAAAVAGDSSLDDQRRDFLTRQVRAMETSLRILQGEKLPLTEEVQALYDVTPTWVDESSFEESFQTLDALLPAGPSLSERMVARRKTLEVSVETARPLLDAMLAELRQRTQERFGLPQDESFELQIVQNQPWSAYNWYLGNCHSRIDVNTDLPLHITRLTDLMAHEGYPGHHTEHSLKDARLLGEQGRIEHAVLLINAPECVVSEGIATRALAAVMSDEELVAWHNGELFPRAGMGHIDAQRELSIDKATRNLRHVSGNVAFLLHDQGASEDEVVGYIQRYGLGTEREARQAVRFLTNPLFRSYTFTYTYGGALLDALFEARGERQHWFGRLLNEPVTPSQIRAWTEQV